MQHGSLRNNQGTNPDKGSHTKTNKNTASRTMPHQTPGQLIKKQLSGIILEDHQYKPRITQFLNIGDFSIHTESIVPIDSPFFEPIPPLIQFTDYEPLQIKSKIFKLRNKDNVARRVKIIQPESRLFQVHPYGPDDGGSEANLKKSKRSVSNSGSKVAPGLEVTFIIKFSPEAKIDYNYDLNIVTEREKFIVPIMAIGKRAMIDFPDSINFGGFCPVKYVTEKPVIIRNLGDKTTKWELKLPPSFDADKKEGVQEYGRSEQIILKFFPLQRRQYEAEACQCYDGLEAWVPMLGQAISGNVYLNKQYIQLDEAYITLETQQTLHIINKSDVKIDFQWRAFQTEAEEQEKKQLLKIQLDEEEAEKRLMLKETATLEHNHDMLEIQDDDDSDYEEVDEKTLMLKKQKKAELLLQRKYKNIKKAIEDNLLLFQDDTFTIEPQTGSIWPKSEMTITVTFKPKAALKYSCAAYCNISCSDQRLLLSLEGEGLGPKAFLSTNNIAIGDIFVNDEAVFYLSMENKGEITATFHLLKNNTPFSNMITFDMKEGDLEVGQRLNFNMTFCSSKVGEFQEIFRWKLDGSSEMLTQLVRGHVRAPSFEFNKPRILFGKVSYQFEETRDITLQNTSTVQFHFHLRIPGDGKNNQKEFEIIPENGVIKQGEHKKIMVKFIPHNRKQYFMVMVQDIDGVGKDMKSIPIVAESDVPNVKLKPEVLNFGDVFLRYPVTEEIELINESNLCARFIVHPQNPDTRVLGTIMTDLDKGQIMPESNLKLHVTLTTGSISWFQLELAIEIVSNTNTTHIVKLIANSIGPIVEVSERELDYGNVPVQSDQQRTITITNKSHIEADFHAFTKNRVSIFKPIQRADKLGPDKSMTIEIVCTADDTQKFTDTLHFVIHEGMDIDVQLRARGVGNTLFCKEDPRFINFGIQYTFRNQTKEIFFENKGRRPQKLVWQRKQKPQEKKKDEGNQKNQAQSKKQIPEEENITFTIIPESVTLPPKNGIMFQFRANSTRRGQVEEEFTLSSMVGNERKPNILYPTKVEGMFINPSLTFSPMNNKVYFKYTWQKNVPCKPLSQNIEITCGSILPTNFDLVIDQPFSVYPDRFSLLPGKSATARLDFNPALKHDRISDTTKKKLQVRHYKHPHVEYVDVVGEVCFPNQKMETSTVNFGSVLNDTSKKILMKMTNVSEMAVHYEWSFLEDEFQMNANKDGEQISTK